MKHGGDIYNNSVEMDFSVNLNPLGPPAKVTQVLEKAIEKAPFYPDIEQREVRSVIARGEGIDISNVYAGNGASEIIMALVRAVNPGKALLFEPGFSGYEYALNAAGCHIEHHLLCEKNGFVMKEEDIEALTDDLDIIFICDPGNPVGRNIEDDVIVSILDKTRECGIIVCLDESFFLMSDKSQRGDVLKRSELVERYENLVIIRSLTKILAMPGIRMGYVLSQPENIRRIRAQLPEWNLSVTSEACIRAGAELLHETDFLQRTIEEIRTGRNYLTQELRNIGFTVFDSDTGFILFKGPEDLYERLLKKQILIRDCSDFKGLNKGFYRIAVKNQEENSRLIQALRSW